MNLPATTWRDLPPVSDEERALVTFTREPSQTFLGWHDLCDRAAFLYRKHHGGAGGHQLNRGSLFHEAVARLTRHLIEQGERQAPPELGKDYVVEVVRDLLELATPAYERDQLRGMIFNWCDGSFFWPERIVGVEQDLQLQVGEWTIRCRLDLIEQLDHRTLDVTDYKTQWNMPRTADVGEWSTGGVDGNGNARFGGNFQTTVYALACAFGTTPDGLSIGDGIDRFRVYLRFPRLLRDEGLAYREAIIDRRQLLDFRLDLEAQLARLGRSIETGKWQPTPGSHCERCPAAAECPLPRHLRAESQATEWETLEELETHAANWYFMAQRATQLKSRIRAAAERLGVPEVRTGEDLALLFKFYERESLKDGALADIRVGIEGAVKYGHPFNLADFVTYSQGTEFVKRKVAPRRAAREETDGTNEESDAGGS